MPGNRNIVQERKINIDYGLAPKNYVDYKYGSDPPTLQRYACLPARGRGQSVYKMVSPHFPQWNVNTHFLEQNIKSKITVSACYTEVKR